MSEISFPLNPSNNQVYTVNGRYWRWDGVSWNSIINDNYGDILYNNDGSAGTIASGSSGLVLISNGSGYYWGPNGISGFSGWSGISGWSGLSGYSGFSGVSGFSGWSGISGTSGYSGVSGYSGWSGVSGFSGFSGGSSSDLIYAIDDTSTTTLYPVMIDSINTDSTAKTTTSKLSFDASTGLLTSTLLSARFQSHTETITSVGTITANYSVNTSLSNIFDITLGANNLTITFENPPANNILKTVTILLKQDSTGSRFVTFANSKYTDGTLPVLSTGADSIDVLTFFTPDGGTNWYGSFAMANVS